MNARLYPLSVLTILLAACGDGGSSSTELAGPAVSSKDSGQTLSAAELSGDASQYEVPNAAATRPPTPSKRAEGTYILGSTVRRAIEAGSATYHAASEVPPGTDTIWLRSDFQAHDRLATWMMDTIPRPEDCIRCLPNVRLYPASTIVFPLLLGRGGLTSLGSFIYVRQLGTQGEIQELFRRSEGSFKIHDNFKYLLNTTAAEWRDSSGNDDFVQLQLATFPPSDAVFKLCLHQSLGEVRRLTCTLHDRQTAERVGVHVIDDSTSSGPVEFVSTLPASHSSPATETRNQMWPG
jgi:hypothetical protein